MLLLTADEDSRKAPRANEVLFSCFEATSMSQAAEALEGKKTQRQKQAEGTPEQGTYLRKPDNTSHYVSQETYGIDRANVWINTSPFINSWYRERGKHSVIGVNVFQHGLKKVCAISQSDSLPVLGRVMTYPTVVITLIYENAYDRIKT